MSPLWSLALCGVAIYCGIQVVRDIRDRAYWMAGFGICCLVAVLLIPLPSQSITIELPVANAG